LIPEWRRRRMTSSIDPKKIDQRVWIGGRGGVVDHGLVEQPAFGYPGVNRR